MQVSARGDYAVRAALGLAAAYPSTVSAQTLADEQSMPRKFLEAILADLRRADLVRILLTLGDGRALPAGTLAAEAGVAPSTASGHLAQLVDGGLLRVEPNGRHRYYRLAGPRVGRLIETLAQLAPVRPVRSLR